MKGARGKDVLEVFTKVYMPRVQLINDQSEDLAASMTGNYSKKNPLNLQLSDENLSVSGPKLVDVEWKVIYNLSSKNLNKLHQPKFLITLTLLCQGDFKRGTPIETVAFSSKRNQLRLHRIQFQCSYQELTHFNFKVKNAINALETFARAPKTDAKK